MASFEYQPEKAHGKPAMARVPMTMVMKVAGIFLESPPIWRMSLVCTAWITEPAPRKRRALKKAWVVRWNIPEV